MNDSEPSLHYKTSINEDAEHICKLGRALSSEERIKIIRLLQIKPHNLIEMSNILNIPISTVSFHVNALEDARIIKIDYKPAIKGHMKLCSLQAIAASIQFTKPEDEKENEKIMIEMPVGLYSKCEINNAYLAGSNGFIYRENNYKYLLFTPERIEGELFAFQDGYVIYNFPNLFLNNNDKRRLEFSFECCSEAPFYREIWPSDVTIWINDVEIATVCLPGDFGGKRGTYTPKYWMTNSTQFGLLKSFSIDDNGCYVDNIFDNKNHTFEDLNLKDGKEIRLKIGFKKDAKHIGGINIFGRNFGNFPQAIQMTLSKRY